MFYHVVLTTKCNLQCRYCYGKFVEDISTDFKRGTEFFEMPEDAEFDIEKLKKFVEKDEDAYITFYGGEPLLKLDLIKRIMNSVTVKGFMMQTNGLFLHILPKEYANRLHTVLVSIDGKRNLTDFNRGVGTFDKVIENCKRLNTNGFEGELIARMTVDEHTDIYDNVVFLLEEADFRSVHWQLGANFWRGDYNKRNFSDWAKKYNAQVSRLIEYWIENMRRGDVLKIYPLLGILSSILKGEDTLLRCGSGFENFTISTNGMVVPCLVMYGMKDYICGNLESNPQKLKKYFVNSKCKKCNYFKLCGGRCLYSDIVKPWPKEGKEVLCGTVKHLINELKARKSEVEGLIKEGKIKLSDFDYLKYNGCEIIP